MRHQFATVASSVPVAQQEQPPKPAEHSVRSLHFPLFAPAFLLAYALAAGPLSKIDEAYHLGTRYPRVHDALGCAYEPLRLLLSRSPALDRFYAWYIGNVCRVHYAVGQDNPSASPRSPAKN